MKVMPVIKKLAVWVIPPILGISAAVVTDIIMHSKEVKTNEPATINVPAPSEAVVSEQNTGYTLREYEGCIAVFSDGSSEPMQVYDVYVNTMSDYDREALSDGIHAADIEELQRLVEDYTS